MNNECGHLAGMLQGRRAGVGLYWEWMIKTGLQGWAGMDHWLEHCSNNRDYVMIMCAALRLLQRTFSTQEVKRQCGKRKRPVYSIVVNVCKMPPWENPDTAKLPFPGGEGKFFPASTYSISIFNRVGDVSDVLTANQLRRPQLHTIIHSFRGWTSLQSEGVNTWGGVKGQGWGCIQKIPASKTFITIGCFSVQG